MPFDVYPTRSAQHHTRVDQYVVAYLSRLTDDDAQAVIDEHTPPNLGAGVDLYAGQPPVGV